MAHTTFRDRVVALANSTQQDPTGFLEGLSVIHPDWHRDREGYGFLLFHHRVVRYFNSIVNAPLSLSITAYSADELSAMDISPFSGDGGTTLLGLSNFSSSIEGWHNAAHARLEDVTGVPMMDPAQNIYYRPFWRLHGHIDRLFQQALERYASAAHPSEFLTVSAIASHIETGHHTWVPRI